MGYIDALVDFPDYRFDQEHSNILKLKYQSGRPSSDSLSCVIRVPTIGSLSDFTGFFTWLYGKCLNLEWFHERQRDTKTWVHFIYECIVQPAH